MKIIAIEQVVFSFFYLLAFLSDLNPTERGLKAEGARLLPVGERV